jgi:CHAD domain-containing protein
MEQVNLLLKCWIQQKQAFVENLLISRKRPTIVSVHDLRVAIKKLRSYLRLKQELNGDEWKTPFSTISALFRSLARVRDFDTSLALLRKQKHKNLSSLLFFKEYLFANRSLSRKLATQDAVKFNEQDLTAFDSQFNLELSDKEICEKIIQHSILRIKKVKELASHFKKNAHKVRKQLKDVYNWVKIRPEYFDKRFINIDALDQVLKHLGDWQDHFVFRNYIEQYIKDLPGNKERTILKSLGKKLNTVQDEFLQKARDKWKDVMPEHVK